MNSTIEIMNIKELRQILVAMNRCDTMQRQEYLDAPAEDVLCNMGQLCDGCIDKLAGLMEWAEDMENSDTTGQLPS
jgi:hypothetical protein